jgi:hypothetical protein
MLQHPDNNLKLNFVKSLFKIQFQNHYFLFRLVASVEILKGSDQTIMYAPTFRKPILIFMNNS